MIKRTGSFTYESDGDMLTVKILGEIDHHCAVSVRGDIDELIYKCRPKMLRIDLSEVGFMDSSGLGLIMGRYSLMSKLGGETVVKDPCEPISRILSLAGIGKIIRIERTKKSRK